MPSIKNIFNDAPISYKNVSNKGLEDKISHKDHLGTQDYAKALSEFIKECETPMTIGI